MKLDDEGAEAFQTPLKSIFKSKERIQIFECIAQSDGIRNKDVAENVGCDRSTVTKLTTDLESGGLLEKGPEQELRLTPLGECLAPSLLELMYRGAIVGEHLSPFFSQLATTADTGLEEIVDDLATAEVMEVSGGVGAKAKQKYRELIDSHGYVQELATVRTFPGDSYPERLNDELNGEFVLKKSLADRLRTEDPAFLESLIEADGTDYVKEVETDFDFTISIFKNSADAFRGTVALIQMEKFVIVTTQDETVLKWAEDCFEGYAEEGNEIEIDM